MKALARFVKATLIGGLLIVLPAWVAVLLLVKAVGVLAALLKPLIAPLGGEVRYPTLVALLLLVVVCFVVGLLIQTAVGRSLRRQLETRVLNRIPGYKVVRALADQLADQRHAEGWAPALVEIEEALVPAFIVERHADGRCTVFVPSSPTPAMGSVYILTAERVHPVDVPFMKAAGCVSKWGSGSGELLAALGPGVTGAGVRANAERG